jgi:hypothetical protein
MTIMLGWILGWGLVGYNLSDADLFAPCKTRCAEKPYAVGAYKVGR